MTNYFYAYYILRTLTGMVGDGSMICLPLAYLADNLPDRQRASAFGILSGVGSASFVCGTLAVRFLSTSSTFQVAAFVSMLAVVYMRIFLEESMPNDADGLTRPILKEGPDVIQNNSDEPSKIVVFRKIPSVKDFICFLRSSSSFSQAAVVAFFNSLAEGGMMASMNYFLKARFHFNKNQYADLMLISGVLGAVSLLLLMPMLAPRIGEGKLLSTGLLVSCINGLLCSISWSAWVPYAATVFSMLMVLASPCLRSIASKQVGPREQGKAQGCISGISSLANIISPLIFSPLTALFLSENAPFYFPGFSIMCIGLASMISFIQSLMIKSVTLTPSTKINSNCLDA
ncbi:hypothetical protein SLEP1_g33632 [Rubroshorea leprosula]|uniref:Major facilitator superfamily (MFS) profile domain-containing protein n=1 Tax=Rubroshorea leprosula TaxID=152421 RepID=A0AAV5KH92_9ROSI|nr:hypothetical protein SLEP1_g33632 [Rubroshorea leprosula]